ncbi:MAG: glycosyltransferase [Candidatus Ancaeobacter aquaticus]|nr:glycosyltransferase [Candidatus Ancaeobacter aquaticus]
MDLSIIIINWNTAYLLMECLDSVYKSIGDFQYEVIVVDNGSCDGSVEAIGYNFPQTRIIQNQSNVGFAKANNMALKTVTGRYALLLNSDTCVYPDTVKRFVEYMDNENDVAACCGQLYDRDGTKQNSYSVFPSLITELLNKSLLKLLMPWWYPSKWKVYNVPADIDAVIGACMMVRMADINEIGMFDEDYFFFFEETDWCKRAHDHLKKIVFIPHARIMHAQGQSVSKDYVSSSIEYYRSRYIYFRKHKNRLESFLLRVGLGVKLCIDMIINMLGFVVTLSCTRRYRQKLFILFNIMLWHLKLCPKRYGLSFIYPCRGQISFKDGKLNVSVCVITFNEEKNIRECLESVKWFGQIIVLDSQSTDKTVEIAREYTDKVYQVPWEGFSKNKNMCIEKATKEWVFVIDADERVTSELANECTLLYGDNNGYSVARKNFFLCRWIKSCGWYPDYSVRLFKNGKGKFKERMVHEAVHIEGKKGKLHNPLLHFTYTSIRQFIGRLNRYSTLAAKEMQRDPERDYSKKKALLFAELLIRPQFTFFKMYIIKYGFLDGLYGFVISSMYAYYVFLKYAKLYERTKK